MREAIKIPDEWVSIELGKTCNIVMGHSPDGNTINRSNLGCAFLQGNAEFGKKYPTEKNWTTSPTRIANKDSILLSVRAPVGALNIANKDYCIGRGLASLTYKGYSLDYLYFAISHNSYQFKNLSQGSTFEAVNRKNIEELKILTPKIKQEQQKIAEILSEVDNAISSAESLLKKNKKLKIALMQDLLSCGIDENGNIRNLQTHNFKPSELGDIPEEWDCALFVDLLDVIDGDRGDNYPTQTDFYKDEFCLFLNAKNVTKNGFNFEENFFITKEKDSKLSKGRLEKHDFVLTTRGTVGNIAYNDESVKFNYIRINSGMVILRLAKDRVFHKYFYEFMNSEIFELQKTTVMFGSAQQQLTVAQIKKFICIFPKSKTEQQKIADILSSQDEKIEAVQTKLTKLKSLKASLMQDLLSGKKRVTKLMGKA